MKDLKELKNLTLLYVEDNEEVARVTTMVLEEYIERGFGGKKWHRSLADFQHLSS